MGVIKRDNKQLMVCVISVPVESIFLVFKLNPVIFYT